MLRKIIHIDEEKCSGCGLCVRACHEGAIDLADGKARLVREHFCDGLGDCLPACPEGAITFEEREAPAYDEQAVLAAKKPSVSVRIAQSLTASARPANWPVQLRLAPIKSPALKGELLIAADCTAYAYADLHRDFLCGHPVLIGCPKLDAVDYSLKLTEILRNNPVTGITLIRMEVPCCGGLKAAADKARTACGKDLPMKTVTIRTDGTLFSD